MDLYSAYFVTNFNGTEHASGEAEERFQAVFEGREKARQRDYCL